MKASIKPGAIQVDTRLRTSDPPLYCIQAKSTNSCTTPGGQFALLAIVTEDPGLGVKVLPNTVPLFKDYHDFVKTREDVQKRYARNIYDIQRLEDGSIQARPYVRWAVLDNFTPLLLVDLLVKLGDRQFFILSGLNSFRSVNKQEQLNLFDTITDTLRIDD